MNAMASELRRHRSADEDDTDLRKSLTAVARISAQIEELKVQKDRLAGAYRKRERARDTRRKIILGALVIASNEDAETRGLPPTAWMQVLDERLTDAGARMLFNLPPLAPCRGQVHSEQDKPGGKNE